MHIFQLLLLSRDPGTKWSLEAAYLPPRTPGSGRDDSYLPCPQLLVTHSTIAPATGEQPASADLNRKWWGGWVTREKARKQDQRQPRRKTITQNTDLFKFKEFLVFSLPLKPYESNSVHPPASLSEHRLRVSCHTTAHPYKGATI